MFVLSGLSHEIAGIAPRSLGLGFASSIMPDLIPLRERMREALRDYATRLTWSGCQR